MRLTADPSVLSLAVYRDNRHALVDYAHSIVQDRLAAEDIVQEAWLKISRLEPNADLRHPLRYFYRVVRNLAFDTYRTQRRSDQRRGGELSSLEDTLVDQAPSPEAQTLARLELFRVMQALDDLPPRTRRAVVLYKIDGLKLREVAEAMGISIALANALVLDGVSHCAHVVGRKP